MGDAMMALMEIVLDSELSDEQKHAKLKVLLKERMEFLGDPVKLAVGQQIALDHLDGFIESLLNLDDDLVFHMAMQTTVSYVLASITRQSGFDSALLREGQGEHLTREVYSYIRERLSEHLQELQDEHDRIELN